MMSRRSLVRLLACVVAFVAAVNVIAAQAPRADPDHARLIALAGTWDVEMMFKFRPDGPGLPVKGVLNGVPFTTLAWTGYNTGTKQYEATRIASTNTARIVETGTYDDPTRTLELNADYALAGETWHQRTVVQLISADGMIATSYLSFGTVPEWRGVEIKYTRQR